jgi:predicted HNH restriction endonuclease
VSNFKIHLCKICGEDNPANFYNDQKIKCKKCHSKATYQRQKGIRLRLLEEFGAKCQICGYSKYSGALEFHHRDPTQKDPKQFNSWGNYEKQRKELDKCVLLCSNCHKEVHGEVAELG